MVESCLVRQPVQKGNFVYIPAGSVHALGKGICAFEIQQSSDITDRLYDWGRKRGETYIAQGLRAVSYDVPALCVSQFLDFFSCPYFSLRTVCSCTITDTDDFALFMLTGGMLYGGTESFAVSVEDAVFCHGGETAALETDMRAVCHAVLSNSLLCSFYFVPQTIKTDPAI